MRFAIHKPGVLWGFCTTNNMTKPRPFGHYFILEKIAQGGMAEIFKGLTYDFMGLKKFIVIKRILPHIAANKEFIDMLVAEAKIAVNLSHGNIAQIFDLGKVGNDYFIVMEYVDGKNLSQIQRAALESRQRVPVEYCVYFISALCDALDYMHRKKDEQGNELKIVHRDISPQNIIISYSGNVKVVDFGVAKAAFKLGEGEKGILKGKFAYMSPEQAEGEEIDSRSDIFSAGIVLWEMLVAQRLFKKKSNSETVMAVKEMSILPPSQFRDDIHDELDNIVMKALQRDPEKRYQSAHDMGLDLTKYLLKYYPEFKPNNVSSYLSFLFARDEEVTGDIHFEKTHREEATLVDSSVRTQIPPLENTTLLRYDDTQIVDPKEIDFKSIFDEISWEDESEVSLSEENIEMPMPVVSNLDELSVTGVYKESLKELPPKNKSWIFSLVFSLLILLLVISVLIYFAR